MTVKTCSDCNAPIGDDMLPTKAHGCWWWGQTEEWQRRNGWSEAAIHDFAHCGADPPCEGNAYNARESARGRERMLGFVTALLIIGGTVVLITYFTR